MNTPSKAKNTTVHTSSSETNVFDIAAAVVYIATLFLAPLFFLAPSSFPLLEGKHIVIVSGMVSAVVLWSLGRLKAGAVSVPQNPLIWAVGGLIAVYAVGSLVANPVWVAFIGSGFAIDSFVTFITLTASLLLGPLVLTDGRSVLWAYLAMLAAGIFIALFVGVQLLAGIDWVSFESVSAATIFGSWQDTGIFFGLLSVIVMSGLVLIKLRWWLRTVLYGALLASLTYVTLSGVAGVWWILFFLSAVFLLYLLVPFGQSGRVSLPSRYFIPAVIVLVVSITGMAVGGGSGVGIPQGLNIQHESQELSVGSTLSVTKDSIAGSPIFGIGPNRFDIAFSKYTPESVYTTPGWNINFTAGSSYLTTAPATLGVTGVIAWSVFIILFVAVGIRAVVITRRRQPFWRFITVSSFLAALFSLIAFGLYVPNIVMLFFGFVFLGIFIAVLYQQGIIPQYNLSFVQRPKAGFVSIILLALISVGAISTLYVQINSFLAQANFHRAEIHLTNGSFQEAAQDMEAALQTRRHDLYYRTAARTHLRQLERRLAQNQVGANAVQNMLATALSNARNAIQLDRPDYNNWMVLGQIYAALVPHDVDGAYAQATEAYNAATARNPADPQLLLAQSRLALSAGNTQEAKQLAQKAQSIKPNYTAAAFLLTRLEVQSGDIAAAIESARSATEIAPNDPTLFFQLGLLEYESENLARATQAFEEAVDLAPTYANAKYYLGLVYARQDEPEKAIDTLEDVLETNPDNDRVREIIQNITNNKPPLAGLEAADTPSDALPIDNQ